ncbi:MAG: Uncharacterised protein [Alphaproteobacteria bacterium]|nr:MAG: Uncharacterised protein [Alphaproteobacteria bacterium]
MTKLIWLHEDCLRASHNVFSHAPDAQAVFIWDDAHMAAMHFGLKRRVFIYESLCQLPVEIYVGDTVSALMQLADRGQEIVTGKSPNSALKNIMQALRETIKVSAIADDPFVQMDSPPDLRRFFKYWNKAKKHAFSYDGRS